MKVKANESKTLNISISARLYNDVFETLPANISIEMLISKLLKAWKQEPSSRDLDKDTKEERSIALLKSAKETVSKKINEMPKSKRKEKKTMPVSVQVANHINVLRNNKI